MDALTSEVSLVEDWRKKHGNYSFEQPSSYRHPSRVAKIENKIKDGVSLMALDSANGKLIGIFLSHTITR